MTTIPQEMQEHLADRIDSPAELARQRRGLRRGRLPLIVAAGGTLGFALVLLFVLLGDPMVVDLRVTLAMQRVRPPGLTELMLAVSWLGFRPQMPLIAVGVVTGLLWRGLRIEAAFAFLAFASYLLNIIKELVQRPRPAADLDGIVVVFTVGGSSFPSGHTLTYTIFYGFLAYLAYTLVRPNAARRALLALLLGVIALVGPSRVYLGQHWFTDVLASYLLGSALLVALLTAYRRAKAWDVARAARAVGRDG